MLLPAPTAIDEMVLDFCCRISPEQPTYLPIRPAPAAIVSHCFDNVAAQILKYGGDIAYGWAIWSWPGVYFEAEHHGVWRSRTGELVDITPGGAGAKRILFLLDPSAVYDPTAYRSNILTAVDGNSTAKEFVSLANAYNQKVDAYRAPGVTHPQFSLTDRILIPVMLASIQRLYENLLSTHPQPSQRA
jgi:hypothetical protein